MRQPTQEDLAAISEAAARGRAVDAPIAGDLRYRTFPGFDPESATFLPPSIVIGHCLKPAFDCFGIFVFDSAEPPYDGSLVRAELRSQDVLGGRSTFATKLLRYVGGSWLLVSNEGVHEIERLAGSLVGMAALVASVEFGPDWPRTTEFEIPDPIRVLGVTTAPACPLWSSENGERPSLDGLGVRHLPANPRRIDSAHFPMRLICPK